MKKLLLLSALLIFACSSDDSSNNDNNSNQNFLQKYNGVTWKFDYDYSVNGDENWTTFNPNGWNVCEFNVLDNDYFGYSYNWGDNVEGVTNNVIENSPERLVLEITEVDDDGEVYTYTSTAEATNNGNNLVIINSGGEIENSGVRVSSNPCD